MAKRMMHPLHGWTHVYNGNDEKYHRALGWVDADEAEKVDPPSEPAAQPEAVDRLKRPVGRPRVNP